jgi:mono/diheme cytochrome c family protein
MVRPHLGSIVAAALVCAALVSCKKESAKPEAAGASPAAAAPGSAAAPAGADGAAPTAAQQAARQLFATTCAMCHGPEGRGDGPASANLNPPPRNYSDKAWQASVADEDLRKIIVEGGVGVGKSPTMPGNPQLRDKPEVVEALVQLIRGFGK